jgi:formyl-CoA transferase
MIEHITMDDGERLAIPGIVPKLSRTPGAHRRNAPVLGQDTLGVLRSVGLSDEQIAALHAKGVIAT